MSGISGLVDGLCIRSDLTPESCWHCRGLPDSPHDFEQEQGEAEDGE